MNKNTPDFRAAHAFCEAGSDAGRTGPVEVGWRPESGPGGVSAAGIRLRSAKPEGGAGAWISPLRTVPVGVPGVGGVRAERAPLAPGRPAAADPCRGERAPPTGRVKPVTDDCRRSRGED